MGKPTNITACYHCMLYLRQGDNYCHKCGRETTASLHMNYDAVTCPKCKNVFNAPQEDDKEKFIEKKSQRKFCNKCGEKLSEVN